MQANKPTTTRRVIVSYPLQKIKLPTDNKQISPKAYLSVIFLSKKKHIRDTRATQQQIKLENTYQLAVWPVQYSSPPHLVPGALIC